MALSACGSPELEGSLRELLDLHYQSAQVNESGDEVAVRFYTPRGAGQDLVLAVSANLGGLDLKPGQKIQLAELDPDGNQRGTVTRNVLNDPRRTFPALEYGQLILNQLPGNSGQDVSGSFSVTFAPGIDFACGRTVFGSFKGKVP